jgi:hypothetical protein
MDRSGNNKDIIRLMISQMPGQYTDKSANFLSRPVTVWRSGDDELEDERARDKAE